MYISNIILYIVYYIFVIKHRWRLLASLEKKIKNQVRDIENSEHKIM